MTNAKLADGSVSTAKVADDAITFAKLQNISANNRILGRSTAGAGDAEEIVLGSGLALSGGTLTAAGSGGTVTSVGVAVPPYMTSSGGPITGSGSITLGFGSQTANTVFAAPNGAPGAPAFRGLVAADIPSLDAGKITSGTLSVAQGGTGAGSFTANRILIGNGTSAIAPAAAITGSRALVSDTNGVPAHSNVTSTELGFLSGVTSALQTQLDSKLSNFSSLSAANVTTALTFTPVNRAGDTMTGALNLPSNGLAVGTNQLVVSGGRVGVGMTPTMHLDVNGTVRASQNIYAFAGSAGVPSFSFEGTGGTTGIFAPTASSFGITTNGVERVRVDGSGNLGIGTSSPSRKLDVNGAVNAQEFILYGDKGFISYYGPASQTVVGDSLNDWGNTLRLGSDTQFWNGGTARMTIANNGNVGIGTSSPSEKLEVVGNIKGTQLCIGADCRSAWPSGGGGGVSQVTSINTDISVANGTTSPALTLNSGTTGGAGDANKIAKLNASGVLAANMIPNLDAGKITTGTLGVNRGGTGAGTFIANGVLFGNGTSAIGATAAGTAGQVLRSGGASAPSWSTATYPGTGGTIGTILRSDGTNFVNSSASYPSTTTQYGLLYSSSNNVIGEIGTANNAVLLTSAIGAPAWSVGTNNRVLRSTGTSVSFAQVALGTDVSGTLPVTNGGTGSTTGSITGSGALTFAAGGTNQNVTLTPSGTGFTILNGNVGIGTTNPSLNLDVLANTTGNFAGFVVRTSDSRSIALKPSHIAGGNNGIVQAGDQALIFSNGTIDTGALVIAPWASGTSGLRMTATGNVGIGTATASERLTVSGNVLATNFFHSSDARLKTEIETSAGLAIIKRLRGVVYRWINSGDRTSGVIAQEVEAVLPDAVRTDPATGLKSVDYDSLVGPMIEAIKEQHRIIESQQEALQNQQRDIESLRKAVEALQRKADRENAN